MPAKALWTAEMLREFPGDGYRYELNKGSLIRMSRSNFWHGALGSKIDHRLRSFAELHDLGEVSVLEAGFVLQRSPDTLRCPDVSFVRKERLADIPRTGFSEIAPDLAVEVISPSNTETEIRQKTSQYFDAGTTSIRVFYPEERKVVVHNRSRETEVLGVDDTLEEPDFLPEFRLPLSGIL